MTSSGRSDDSISRSKPQPLKVELAIATVKYLSKCLYPKMDPEILSEDFIEHSEYYLDWMYPPEKKYLVKTASGRKHLAKEIVSKSSEMIRKFYEKRPSSRLHVEAVGAAVFYLVCFANKVYVNHKGLAERIGYSASTIRNAEKKLLKALKDDKKLLLSLGPNANIIYGCFLQ